MGYSMPMLFLDNDDDNDGIPDKDDPDRDGNGKWAGSCETSQMA